MLSMLAGAGRHWQVLKVAGTEQRIDTYLLLIVQIFFWIPKQKVKFLNKEGITNSNFLCLEKKYYCLIFVKGFWKLEKQKNYLHNLNVGKKQIYIYYFILCCENFSNENWLKLEIFWKNYFPNFLFFKFMLLKSYCEYVSIKFS